VLIRLLRPALIAIAGFVLIGPGVAQAAPIVKITQHPAKISNVTNPVFRFSANAVRSASCKIDSRAWVSPCHSPHSFGTLTNGNHTVTYAVVTTSGAKAQVSYSWLLDAAVPAKPDVTGGMASNWSNAASQLVAAHSTDVGSGIDHYVYQAAVWPSGFSGPILTGSQVTITAEGHVELRFSAVDRAGNTSVWSDVVVVNLDRTAPTAPGVLGATGTDSWTSQLSFDQDGTANDDFTNSAVLTAGMNQNMAFQYRYSSDGAVTWTVPQDGEQAVMPGDGVYQIQFRAIDAASNIGDWGAPATVQIDTSI
jgi:hypothetical protein